MKNIALIGNPTLAASLKAAVIVTQIAETLTNKAIKHTVFLKLWPSDWQDFTEIWIVGGDGTLNYFINRYPDNPLPLVLFPGGSGNDFHWALYGNIKPVVQVEKVLQGKVMAIDAGTCNGQWFLNGVGIGFDGAIVHDLLGKSKRAGKASYLLSILKHIIGYRERSCRIHFNAVLIEQDCFMISVANGKRYGGGFRVAPNASVTDGLLDVSIVGKIAPLKRLRYLPVIEKGEHLRLPFIQYSLTQQVSITAEAPLYAHIDGEYISNAHFDIIVAAKKVAFVV